MSATLSNPPFAAAPDLDQARFDTHLSQRAYLPTWWLDAKRAGLETFNALPLPSRLNETWRYANLKGLDLSGFTLPEDPAQHIPHLPDFPHAAELIYSNRQLVGRTTVPAELAARGVIFAPLDEALRDHGDHVRQYFQKHPTNLGSEKFVALNTALTASGAFLYVPAEVECPLPFVVQHTLTGQNVASFPHTIVALGPRAKASVVEFFVSGGSPAERQFVTGVNDLHAAESAQLTYVGVQHWSTATLAFQVNSIAVERDARILALNLHLGGRQARHESHARLLGPGAHSEMLALSIASGAQELDQRTLQTHIATRTTSNLLYKNALLDTAKTIFSGLIIVEPDAQKTDAYQKNRNLLLSDAAEAHSLPGLEIQANDVKCSHGSTSARLDAEQAFYLQARGIPPAAARRLLVAAFFEEVLNQLDNEDLHSALTTLIAGQFKN